MSEITTFILAAGTLGTAAFGFVETLKWWRFGEYGYDELVLNLGELKSTLEEVYSASRLDTVLRMLYRTQPDDLTRILRQGVRAGLTPESAPMVVQGMPNVSVQALQEAACAIQSGHELSTEQRSVLGRYELAADAKIDGALASAKSHYSGKLRLTAGIFAIAVALLTGVIQYVTGEQDLAVIGRALLIGIVAVPMAPIAHDLVDVIQSVATALGPKA